MFNSYFDITGGKVEKTKNIFPTQTRPSPNLPKIHLKKPTPPEANLNMTTMNTTINHQQSLLTTMNIYLIPLLTPLFTSINIYQHHY